MEYVKRSVALFLLVIMAIAGAASVPASAHVLESNNGVSAILHIKPDDRPVSDQPTVVRFLFSSDKGSFQINDYDVKLNLFQEDTLTLSSAVEPAFFGANAEGDTTVTFPEAGVYKLQAQGTPLEEGALPFELNFTVRVTGPSETQTGDGKTPLIISGFSLVVFGMVAAKAIQSGGRYRQKSKN